MGPIITAIRTLTVLPVPGRETPRFGRSLPFFPWVGLLLAAILWAAYTGLATVLPGQPFISSLLLVALVTVLSGALHIDGAADLCDALGGGRTPERVLEILKDSRHGTFGVAAIVFVLLAKVACYAAFVQAGAFAPIALSLAVSRSLQAVSICFLPNARGEGSLAAAFEAGAWVKTLVSVSTAVCCGMLVWRAGSWGAVTAVAAGFISGATTAWYCLRRIGGITGDCVGAISEAAEIAVLIAAVMSIIPRAA